MSHRATLAPGAPAALEPGVVAQGHLGPAGRLQLDRAACHDHRRAAAGDRRVCLCRAAAETLRLWRRGAARSARLSDLADPFAVVEPALRPLRRFAGKSRALRRRGLRRDPVDLRQGLRDRPQDAGRRGRRRRHRSGRGRAHHGGAGAPRHARLFRLQPGQLHQQPGKPRAGHALPARTLPRHSQEGPPCRRRQARDGHRPHRHAGGGRSRARRGCGRSRRHDAGADRGCRLAEQGARGPRERHSAVELRQFRLGRDPSRQAAGRDSQSAARRKRRIQLATGRAPSGRSVLSWWAPARLACRRRVWPRSVDTT